MNILIKNPCSEKWNAMASVEGGRFCESCKSKVHDFSNASADEIKQQYDLNNGKICGRISGNLLAQQFQNTQIRKGYFHSLKVFCWAAILSFGASLFSIPAANAKIIGTIRSKILTVEKDSNKTKEVTIKGIVKDKETGEALVFANVIAFVNDTVTVSGCTTNLDGAYELKINAEKYSQINLRFFYIGYETTVIKDVSLKKNAFVNVDLQIGREILGDLIIIDNWDPYPAPDVFQSGKTLRRKEYRRMPKQ